MAQTEDTYTQQNTTDVLRGFTFPYINQSDIKVSLDGVATTAYSHVGLTQIQFTSAPAVGTAIRIYRETNDLETQATFYSGSAIRAKDLNDNFTQNLYVTQEANNEADSATTIANAATTTATGANTKSDAAVATANATTATANGADTKSDAAVATSNTASTNASAAVATSNTASTNAAAAVATSNTASTNASTALSTANTALTNSRESDGSGGYTSAIEKANAAVATSNTASTNASAAVATSNTSSTNASAAVATSNTASTNSTNAVSTANTASSNATAALNNSRESDGSGGYNSAISIANTASTTATSALNNSRESNGSGGYNSAISIANSASATATASANTVANSAIYQVVANYAALPSLNSVDNAKFYQVSDSTNIENSFSEITGEPSGFTGHSGLSVKLKSNTTASPKVWEWQEYYANDPEIRYRKKLIVENLHTIDENYTIGTNNNASSVGPVAVGANKTLTIPANSLYLIH